MTSYASAITDFWQKMFHGDVRYRDEAVTVTANRDLDHDRRAMVLEPAEGPARLVVTPELADRLDFTGRPDLTELRRRLSDVDIALHGADHLFYFTDAGRRRLLVDGPAGHVRRLTEQDGDLFGEFTAAAPESDLDDAFVELDHWAVFGAFDDGRLVAAASMYPWRKSDLADVGVLTDPSYRGRGHAGHVIRAICRYAYHRRHQPQYRCQLDNEPSVALARSVGMTRFGQWDVVAE